MSLLITGTDTNAGKTVLTTALAAYWQNYCVHSKLSILKLVQAGVGDGELYSQLFSLELDAVAPLRFKAPLAPPLAAAQEGHRIDLEKIWRHYETLRQQVDLVLIEGVGGLGSPITYETTVADLAWDWRLPVILVVPVQLGAIGQAVANVALARQSQVYLKGIVLNCAKPCTAEEIDNWADADLIQTLTGVSVLGLIPHLTDPLNWQTLVQVAANLELERIFPASYLVKR